MGNVAVSASSAQISFLLGFKDLNPEITPELLPLNCVTFICPSLDAGRLAIGKHGEGKVTVLCSEPSTGRGRSRGHQRRIGLNELRPEVGAMDLEIPALKFDRTVCRRRPGSGRSR